MQGAEVLCERCAQPLARERDGVLCIGSREVEGPMILRCRICAREQHWIPAGVRRTALPIRTGPFGLWEREAG